MDGEESGKILRMFLLTRGGKELRRFGTLPGRGQRADR